MDSLGSSYRSLEMSRYPDAPHFAVSIGPLELEMRVVCRFVTFAMQCQLIFLSGAILKLGFEGRTLYAREARLRLRQCARIICHGQGSSCQCMYALLQI